ncbi:hypothetical protein TNCV_408992 [Trichonephila clavipes]|nr:hypothetical protein TNCV_408992 [Trichonephila clavipes]
MGSFHHRFPTESGEFESSKSGFRRLRGFPSSFRGRHLTRAPSRNQSLRGRSFTTALSKKTRIASLVYADKPQMLDHLEDNIRHVIADIRPQMLEKIIENWTSRLDYIRASRGSPMPEIIFKM